MASEGPISALLMILSRKVLGLFRKRDEKRGKSQAQGGKTKVSAPNLYTCSAKYRTFLPFTPDTQITKKSFLKSPPLFGIGSSQH